MKTQWELGEMSIDSLYEYYRLLVDEKDVYAEIVAEYIYLAAIEE